MFISSDTVCMFCGAVGYIEHVSRFCGNAEHIKLNCCNNQLLFSEDNDFINQVENAFTAEEELSEEKEYIDKNISSLEECRSIIERIQWGLERSTIKIPETEKMLLADIKQEYNKL